MIRKILSLFLSFSLIISQPLFAQGIAELNIGKYLNRMPAVKTDSFRPAHLRYVSYDMKADSFQLFLDKGESPKLQDATRELFNYFLIGLSLPNDKFWVNLRPDAPEQIIDPELEKTDMGRIMLEADLQLKKDTSSLTSPQNPEGKEYWDKLYKKAGELFGTENITIPTITRPWIVPGEVIIRESEDSAYIYKANLKVMLEEDYISHQSSAFSLQQYTFSDPRMKELNKYSTQLIKELILPRLTQEINTSKKYAQLRQVFFSLILSRWFKDRYRSQRTEDRAQSTEKSSDYLKFINAGNLDNLTSKDPWSKDYYFNEYKKSFQEGEYNLKEQVTTPTGQVIRSYVSGGIQPVLEEIDSFKVASPLKEYSTIDKILRAGIVYLLIAAGISAVLESRHSPYIMERDKVKTDYIFNNKRADFDARYAIANLLDDKQLPSEDREKLKGFFSDYKVLDRKALLKVTQDALDYFYAQKYKYEIASRLEKIRDGLNPAGSSPLTQKDAKKGFNKSFGNLDRNYGDNSSADRPVAVYWKQMYPQYLPYVNYTVDDKQDLKVMEAKIKELEQSIQIIDKELGLVKFVTDLNEFLGSFKVWRDAAGQELSPQEMEVSSALTQDLPQNSNSPLTTGGIDFTRINYLTRPMGSFQGLDLRLPLLSKGELEGIDINKELASVEQMVNARIDVSTDRLKRLLAAMSQKDAFTSQREAHLLPLLMRLCWLKEEKGSETTPDFRAVLLIADTGLFVEQGIS